MTHPSPSDKQGFHMNRSLFLVGASAAIAFLSIAAASAPTPTTMSGVYTVAQAEQGKELYDGACAMCHGSSLQGSFETPPLTGRLVANWSGSSVGDFHSYLQRAMPLFAPGSISAEDNAKIIAYILKFDGFPAGQTPLPSDPAALAKIRFVPLSPAHLVAKEAGQ